MSNTYKQSTNEQAIEIVNLDELQERAKAIIPAGGFGYISSGSEDEWTLRANREAFNHKLIVPRSLTDMEKPLIDTSIFGIPLKTPVMMAPTAAQGLAHIEGEADTARGVAAVGGLMAQSTYSSRTITETTTAGNGAPQFFQLYMSKDWSFNNALLDQAKAAGIKAIILTVDATVGGYREADVRNKFSFPIPMANLENFSKDNGEGKGISEIYAAAAQKISPKDIARIANYTDLPVIVKGIQSPEDAELAISSGAAGVYVSNHGGRQLNGGPASFDVLASVAQVVNHRVPVIFDSGIRRGSHVFKALASGADLVAFGRPAIYGLALGGAQGVQSVFEHIDDELKIVMQLAGTQTIAAVKQTKLLDNHF
ncbi:lactate oxidase [Loigolactobacillus backii]|uniref:lactate oxidase n=1 Tax=Loigolactobacillus backii TaxID=375175 RepID=UPI0007F18014|nr:lactate oxidase [Loigolactobacillus backii]ANK59064.1 lactate oxidase [Loigolactobacillus backii]ANK64053.1 lactate oxidase [Loigolactobacillus backii]ANK67553.1 lactate oxidase [Loigolactobacillus backii]MDA5387538.1 lactate oxidase [Loigolactobacillus backii]MDA5390098.1 lactate oxidase [Loigolactobacillus backii]